METGRIDVLEHHTSSNVFASAGREGHHPQKGARGGKQRATKEKTIPMNHLAFLAFKRHPKRLERLASKKNPRIKG